MTAPFTTAVLPAAGSGSRLGGTPKQLRLLGDSPLLVHAARAVLGHAWVRTLVVAAPAGESPTVRAMLEAFGVGERAVVVVDGGATRQESVAAALAAVPAESELVLVHDAARPFLPAHCLDAVIAAASEHGAAALAVPVNDTLREARAGVFGRTLDREGLYAMQTPQAARADLLRAAIDSAAREHYAGTDEVALLERAGTRVHLVEGDARNLKLTTPGDWAIAEALVKLMGKGEG